MKDGVSMGMKGGERSRWTKWRQKLKALELKQARKKLRRLSPALPTAEKVLVILLTRSYFEHWFRILHVFCLFRVKSFYFLK